jgi:hypothetical protein
VYQKNAHRASTVWLFFNIKKAVKLNPNRSRIKNEAFSEYGALPHRPTKGLSVFVCLFLPLAATTENLFGNLRAKILGFS